MGVSDKIVLSFYSLNASKDKYVLLFDSSMYIKDMQQKWSLVLGDSVFGYVKFNYVVRELSVGGRIQVSGNPTINSNYSVDVYNTSLPTGIEGTFLSKSESKVVAMYDLQGRKLENVVPGTLVIAVFDDSRRKKIVIGQ